MVCAVVLLMVGVLADLYERAQARNEARREWSRDLETWGRTR
jgi:hypothetical protein